MEVDYSLDQIGKRLSGEGLSDHERILAKDDAVRVAWVREAIGDAPAIYDIGASDGSVTRGLGIVRFLLEQHPAHRAALMEQPNTWVWCGDAFDGLRKLHGATYAIAAAVCAEVLEHLSITEGLRLLMIIPPSCERLIVTVPNRHCASFQDGRERDSWPDHQQHFSDITLKELLIRGGWRVSRIEPIVGESLSDSIWIGAACTRA